MGSFHEFMQMPFTELVVFNVSNDLINDILQIVFVGKEVSQVPVVGRVINACTRVISRRYHDIKRVKTTTILFQVVTRVVTVAALHVLVVLGNILKREVIVFDHDTTVFKSEITGTYSVSF